MKLQFISIVPILAAIACGDGGVETTTSTTTTPTTTTQTTETGTTVTTETGTTVTTETGTTMTTETGTTTTTETGTTVTTETFSPTEGVWRVTDKTFSKNECNLGSDGKKQLAFRLVSVDDSTFVIYDLDNLDVNFECTNTSDLKVYTCTNAVLSDSLLPDMDAVVEITIAPEVMFASTESAQMPYVFTSDCVGTDCAIASAEAGMPFPCETLGSFEMSVPTMPAP